MNDTIVVTGIGIVSPLGSDADSATKMLRDGQAGIGKAAGYESGHLHGAVKDFNVAEYINPREARKMDPISCYTIAAGAQALNQAGLKEDQRQNCGILVGTGFSGLKSLVEHQKKFLRDGITTLSPFHFPNTVYNASAGLAAIKLGVAGPNSTVTGVDVSGEQAVQYGMMMLRQGMVDQMLIIGVDELSQALIKGFSDMRMLDKDEDKPAGPYSRSRSGFNLSEGAAALLLETAASAKARSAKVLATIEGLGLCSAANDSFGYDRSGQAARSAINDALARAKCTMKEIDWVSSSANGSKGLDDSDIELWPVLLDDSDTKVTALKAYFGEFAGSGVLRLALAINAMQQGFVPRMPEQGDYDPGISAYLNVGESGRKAKRFLHHGAGVGGSQVAMVVSAEAA